MKKSVSDVIFFDEKTDVSVYIDMTSHDAAGLTKIAQSFIRDVKSVSGKDAVLTGNPADSKGTVLIAGIAGDCRVIDNLDTQKLIDLSKIKGKREVYEME